MEKKPEKPIYENYENNPSTLLIESISQDEIEPKKQEEAQPTQETIQQQIEQNRSIINNYSESLENNPQNYAFSKEANNEPLLIHDQTLIKHQVNQTIKDIQHNLGPVDKKISHVIHQPIIDQSSEILDKTIFRSSGVLGGSILAFLGSLTYIIFVIYTGITYNFELFFIFLITGFILGLMIEIIYKLLKNIIKHP